MIKAKLINNYVRLVTELPTTDIADYLMQNQILTEKMVEIILNKETSYCFFFAYIFPICLG
jgi:hypothetical protein